MNPTAARLCGIALLWLVSAVIAPDRLEAGACTADEPIDSLTALVTEAIRRGGAESVATDNLLRQLRAGLRKRFAIQRLPPYECLVAVNRAGRIVWRASAAHLSVGIDPELDAWLSNPAERILLIHNHSNSQSLSLADLGQLTKPGVRAVIALGHDTSVYAASVGHTYVAAQAEPTMAVTGAERPRASIVKLGASARAEVDRLMRAPSTMDPDVPHSHVDHLVALALGEAGVIKYDALLGGSRDRSFDRYRHRLDQMVEVATQTIKKELNRLP